MLGEEEKEGRKVSAHIPDISTFPPFFTDCRFRPGCNLEMAPREEAARREVGKSSTTHIGEKRQEAEGGKALLSLYGIALCVWKH